MKKLILTLAVSALVLSTYAQSFDGSKLGKGVKFMPKDSSFAMQMNVRFQNLYQGDYFMDSEVWDDEFVIRRFRLKFNGYAYNPKLQYKIELALSNQDQKNNIPADGSNMVLDAVVKYDFAKGWSLWAGQTKLPGNRERVISSQNMQFVERSNLNSKFTIDRGVGFQVHHEHSAGDVVLRQAVAVTIGEGRNYIHANSGGYDYTFRGEILPFGKFKDNGDYFGADLARETTPKLSIGVTFDHVQDASFSGGQLGKAMGINSSIENYVIDAMFKYNGFSFMGEYVDKWVAGNDAKYEVTAAATDTDKEKRSYFYTGKALNVQAGYLFKSNYEVAGRYTTTKPDHDIDGQNVDFDSDRYSLGLSKYISGHTVKVQSTFSYIDYETAGNSKDEFQVQLQMEIGF